MSSATSAIRSTAPFPTSQDVLRELRSVNEVIRNLAEGAISPVQRSSFALADLTLIGRSYVIKSTDEPQVIATKVKRALGESFFASSVPYGFRMPCAKRLDCSSKTYAKENLSDADFSAIRKELEELISLVAPDWEGELDQVLFMEKIKGQNLYDFFFSNLLVTDEEMPIYAVLEKIGDQLFRRLGRLTFANLALAMFDQGLNPDMGDDYQFLGAEMNLGNVMISHDDEEAILWAIDNEVHPAIFKSEKQNGLYVECLKRVLARPDLASFLAKQTVIAIHKALDFHLSESDKLDREVDRKDIGFLRKQINLLKSNYLDGAGARALEAGFEQGISIFRNKLLPAWDRKSMAQWREKMTVRHPQLCPAFFEAQSERFSAFTQGNIMTSIASYKMWLESIASKIDQPTAEDVRDLGLLVGPTHIYAAPTKIQELAAKVQAAIDHRIAFAIVHKEILKFAKDYGISLLLERKPLERMLTPYGPSPVPPPGGAPGLVKEASNLATIYSAPTSREATPDLAAPAAAADAAAPAAAAPFPMPPKD